MEASDFFGNSDRDYVILQLNQYFRLSLTIRKRKDFFNMAKQQKKTLYNEAFEHDACGIGAVVSIDGKASHGIVDDALSIVEKLEHRAGKDAAGETGDGVGILLQISHNFFSRLALNLGDARDYGVGMFFFPQNSLHRRQAPQAEAPFVQLRQLGLFSLGLQQPGGLNVAMLRRVAQVPLRPLGVLLGPNAVQIAQPQLAGNAGVLLILFQQLFKACGVSLVHLKLLLQHWKGHPPR